MSHTLAIAIVTHDRHDEVRRAIKSCVQYFPTSELWLLDNGTDPVPATHQQIHRKTIYRRLPIGLSLMASRNVAYESITTTHVLNLDDDAYIADASFSKLLHAAIESEPKAGILSCNLRENGTVAFLGQARRSSFFFEGASVFRMAMLRKGVRFDEQLGMYGENLPFLFETLRAGFECVLYPALIVEHCPKYQQRSPRQQRTRLRNHLAQTCLTFFRYFPFFDAGFITIALFLSFLLQSVRQPAKLIVWPQAALRVVLGLPSSLQHRTPIDQTIRTRYLFFEANPLATRSTLPINYTVLHYLRSKFYAARHPSSASGSYERQ